MPALRLPRSALRTVTPSEFFDDSATFIALANRRSQPSAEDRSGPRGSAQRVGVTHAMNWNWADAEGVFKRARSR